MYPELYHQQMLNQTCCSDLPIPQALYQPGMVLLPRWTTVPKGSPNQPPTRIYKTAIKVFLFDTRSQDNTPGRQFGLNLTTSQGGWYLEKVIVSKFQQFHAYLTWFKPWQGGVCWPTSPELAPETPEFSISGGDTFWSITQPLVDEIIWKFFW